MKKFLCLFFLLGFNALTFADTASTTPPPAPPPATGATSASAQVTLSQSSAQLDETKALFHHAEYKYLSHPKNTQKHLVLKTQDGDDNAN